MRWLGRWLLRLLIFGGLLLLAGVGYTRFPSAAVAPDLRLDPDTEYAVILLHGVGGETEPLMLEIADRFRTGLADQPGAQVVHYVWAPWSDSRLRSGAHGIEMAGQLAEQLAALTKLRHVRLIVHSAGARFPDPLCARYRELATRPAHIEATFIDGMGIRGLLDVNYGYRNFGSCPDFAAAFFSHDGDVPGTNEPLVHAYNTDVTDAPGRSESGLDSHHWPLGYFLAKFSAAEMEPGLRSHDQLPRGQTVYVGSVYD